MIRSICSETTRGDLSYEKGLATTLMITDLLFRARTLLMSQMKIFLGLLVCAQVGCVAVTPVDVEIFEFAVSRQPEESSASNLYELGGILYSDNFDVDRSNWIAEIRDPGSVGIRNGVMEIDVARGCTVWFREKLSGPILIEYEIKAVEEGGPNDSLNDMNIFWMAQDLECPDDLFHPGHGRKGDFSDYHSLRLYYVGHGKDYATGIGRVRFRRYPGDGSRPLLPEHILDDNSFLISGNVTRRVRVVACQDRIQYFSDGEMIYDFLDLSPYTNGWFAFRTVHSHLTIDNFRVFQLRVPK